MKFGSSWSDGMTPSDSSGSYQHHYVDFEVCSQCCCVCVCAPGIMVGDGAICLFSHSFKYHFIEHLFWEMSVNRSVKPDSYPLEVPDLIKEISAQ